MGKIFVKISADHDTNGVVMPTILHWIDGCRYKIKVIEMKMAASLKAGGQGMRYTCQIDNKQCYLFCDEGRWFVEK